MIMRWTVAAVADGASNFSPASGTHEGMATALNDHENTVSGAAQKRCVA
jgi:hypothetical protein